MSKRRRKKKRKSRPSRRAQQPRRPSVDLQRILAQADRLIDRDRAQEAIALLEPLLTSYPRVADLHYYLGYAHVKAGDLWGGLPKYERAMELSRTPGYWLPLASLYLDLELNAHALHAFRQVLKQRLDVPKGYGVRVAIAMLEESIKETARNLGLQVPQVEKGLHHLEVGQRLLQMGNFRACIAANRQAIQLLGDWPPPRNNLSLALFFDGQPQEAIATARQVLAQNPDNLQALSNAIRFLAWTGQEEEARALWTRLREIEPLDNTDRLKMAEAAAILQKDERVYELLRPLDELGAAQVSAPQSSRSVQLFLAVAEANLGKRTARKRLRALQERVPWASDLLAALKAGQPGPGWAERFPYFHSTELVPRRQMEELVSLVSHQDEIPPERLRRQVTDFAARFPQIVLMAEKWIREENQPKAGISLLATLATPAAHAALRRFGLSRAGDDKVRIEALLALSQAGAIAPDEMLRVWLQGEWREVQLRAYEISDEPRTTYSPQVVDLLDRGLTALKKGNLTQAERLLRRALKLDPRAKEAYNNLGTIYARREDQARAREMFQAAVEIDPTYTFPRCNLALYLLGDGDVEGASAMLAPLADATHFHPQEMAFYSYTQARISIQRKEYETARNALEAALQIVPGYQPAEELLERLGMITRIQSGFDSFFTQQRARQQAKRARLQAKLSRPDPSLSEALPLYTKDVLTGMGRVILPRGGWTGLRKAELVEQLVAGLGDPDNVEQLVADLTDEERAALRQVLAQGGSMPWQDFDAEYGNDLEESPYWQWHVPQTAMGRLRLRGLLVETTVDGELLVAVPLELRQTLKEALG